MKHLILIGTILAGGNAWAEVILQGEILSDFPAVVNRGELPKHSLSQRGLPQILDNNNALIHIATKRSSSPIGRDELIPNVLSISRAKGAGPSDGYSKQERVFEFDSNIKDFALYEQTHVLVLLASGEIKNLSIEDKTELTSYTTPCRETLAKIQVVGDSVYCVYRQSDEKGEGLYRINVLDGSNAWTRILSTRDAKDRSISSFFVAGETYYPTVLPNDFATSFVEIDYSIPILRGRIASSAPDKLLRVSFRGSGGVSSMIGFYHHNYDLFAFGENAIIFRSNNMMIVSFEKDKGKIVSFDKVEGASGSTALYHRLGFWNIKQVGAEKLHLVVGYGGGDRDQTTDSFIVEVSRKELESYVDI